MTFYIQKKTPGDNGWYWERIDSGSREFVFESAIEALERCDEIRANTPNDGIQRGYRVVDDTGRIVVYRTEEIDE